MTQPGQGGGAAAPLLPRGDANVFEYSQPGPHDYSFIASNAVMKSDSTVKNGMGCLLHYAFRSGTMCLPPSYSLSPFSLAVFGLRASLSWNLKGRYINIQNK